MKDRVYLIFTVAVTALSMTMYFFNAKVESTTKEFDTPVKEEKVYINLNSATLEELMKIPGIGEKKANDILEFKRKNGAFKNPEELMEISGIKENTFNKISRYIYVSE